MAAAVLRVTGGAGLPPSPVVTARSTATPITAEVVLDQARTVLAGERLAVLRFPASSTGAVAVVAHPSGHWGESLDSGYTAWIDPYDGTVIRVDRPQDLPLGAHILKSVETWHFGKVGGIAGRVFWALGGIAPLILLISGASMWWHRKGFRRRPGAG